MSLPEVDMDALVVEVPEEEDPRVTFAPDAELASVLEKINRSAEDDVAVAPREAPAPAPVEPVVRVTPARDTFDEKLKTLEKLDRLQEHESRRKHREAQDTAAVFEKMAQLPPPKKKSHAELVLEGAADASEEVALYMRYFRQYTRFKNEMGLNGSGKRVTFMSTKLEQLIEEVELQKVQASEKRAVGKLPLLMKGFISGVEAFVASVADPADFSLASLGDEWDRTLAADTDLQQALLQLEIEYAHKFAVSPKLYVAYALGDMCFRVAAKNKVAHHNGAASRRNVEVDADSLAAQYGDDL